ncbi:hypothetical protein DMA11_12900 [Marinilabiliaceae bacterium JC017]|nr:hypothetical protein DMA11_12900 [Marinilabiliaceae bacterium JC017]
MQQFEPLEQGYYYHIFNRGINGCNLFSKSENYEYFLRLYEKYIPPVADTFAWVLIPNHFHLLIRIKEPRPMVTPVRVDKQDGYSPDRGRNPNGDKNPSQQFANLFNSYAQAYNKWFSRHGSLFERPFKRKRITDKKYFQHLILYIHNNPVHHGFCQHPLEYGWSSYLSVLSEKQTNLKREKVIKWFNDKNNFKIMHQKKQDITAIEEWLEI